MIERAAAGASVELKGASAHASLCLSLCARHQRSRYPSDLTQLYQLAVHKPDFRGVRDQKSESDQRSQSANRL